MFFLTTIFVVAGFFVFSVATVHAASEGDVVITEFMFNPSAVLDSAGEWIEVQNTTGLAIDLDGWKVDDHTISSSVNIAAGESAVLCVNSDISLNGGVVCAYDLTSVSLGNDGDTVTIKDGDDVVIYSITYTAEDVLEGKSTNVADGSVFTIEEVNQYGDGDYGTPAGNTVSILDHSYPTIQLAVDAASVDDIIIVGAETYTEDLILDNGVSIKGAGSDVTTFVGNHVIIGSNISIDGVTFVPGASGAAITIDSSSFEIDNTNISNSVFVLTQGPLAAVYVGGSNPANLISGLTLESNTFGFAQPYPTNNFVFIYGYITIDGVDAPVGTVVDVIDGAGNVAGRHVVDTAGVYGALAIYKDDIDTDYDEGADQDEVLTVRVNGQTVGTTTYGSFGDDTQMDFAITTATQSYQCVQIGGTPGNPISAIVEDFNFLNNNVDNCLVSVNVKDNDITDILFSGNVFTNTDGALHIWGESSSPSGVLSGVALTNNSFDTTNAYAVQVDLDSYNAIDARSNWWGSANGPTSTLNSYNKSSQGVSASGILIIAPWLTDGTDTDLATIGFQPDTANVVAPVAVGTSYYGSIQSAIDGATSGDIVTISEGSFTENLSIDIGITLQGTGTSTTSIIGEHIISASNVSVSSFGLSAGGSGTIFTLDSSNQVLDGINISNNAFDLSVGHSVGIYLGGTTPTNTVSGIIMSRNLFSGPSDKICNAWKIGGSFGSVLSVEVSGVTFSNNIVDKCSTPINLQNKYLSNISITGNKFTNTDGVVYVWGEGTPTGVLSGFEFTRNVVDITSSYGIKIDLDGATVFGDDNFGEGNKIQENIFSGVGAEFDAMNIFSTLSSYTFNAEKNYWGSLSGPTHESNEEGTGGAVSDNIDFDPWFNSVARTALSDGIVANAQLTSTTSGQADLPEGETDVELTDDTLLDLTSGLSTASGTSITVGGSTLDLGNFTSGNMSTVDLTIPQIIGDASVTVAQAVKLMSGTVGEPIILTNNSVGAPSVTVSIPDNITVMAPSGWTGTMQPPKTGSSLGTAPGGFDVGGTVVDVGDPLVTLLFDKPVKVTLTGVTGSVAYKPAGSSVWKQITTMCNSVSDYSNISFPGECYATSGDDTIIWTYHFTSFASITSTPAPAPPASSGGGYSSAVRSPEAPKVVINNNNTTTTSSSVTLSISATRMTSSYAPLSVRISNKSDMIDAEWIDFLEDIQWNLEEGLGKKIVYVQFKNKSGTSSVTSDDIEVIFGDQDETGEVKTNEEDQTTDMPQPPLPQVLGAREYSDGTLIRGSDKKIYVLQNHIRKHISSLEELSMNYAGQEIFDVADDVVASYAQVAGEKEYGVGQLIRGSDKKIYVIELEGKKHIKSLEELARYYFGKPIYDISDSMLSQY